MTHASNIAVIGAGLAGLSALYRLVYHYASNPVAQPPQFTILDKSRGLGGRLATRRLPNEAAFDHGAQYIRASDPGLLSLLDKACRHGHAARWTAPIADGPPLTVDDERPRFIGKPGMSALGRFMLGECDKVAKAGGLTIERHRQAEITTMAHGDQGWLLEDQAGYQLGPYDLVILAIPAPQAAVLLDRVDGPIADHLKALKTAATTPMVPCWSAMVAFENALDLKAPALQPPKDSPLVWIASSLRHEDQAKTMPKAWHGYVVHAGPEWSEKHLEQPADEVLEAMMAALSATLGQALPTVVHKTAHRWRYAFAPDAGGRACHGAEPARLILAGDWCLGNRAEAAYLSGVAAADMAIDMTGATS
ncbi:MAG: FAD-dependent oxidoreductase [Pseudomonadota bacterium]